MDRTELIASLLYKHLQGTLSPEEQATLQAWLDENPSHQNLLAKNSDAAELAHALQAWYQIPRTGLQDDPTLLKRIQHSKRRLALYTYITKAAILLVVLATTLYFYTDVFVNRNPAIVDEIGPGGNRATLTLADGTKVALDSAQSGIIVNDEDIKYNDGKNILAETGRGPGAPDLTTQYSILTTPKGGQYQIILSDGTKVWLNAASTLKYPSRFSGAIREVLLDGEGFFEIAENKAKPFKVLSKSQEITVLGTSFNVSAFADEEETKTTLIKGQVRVISLASRSSRLLSPNQQSVLKNDSLVISLADANAETGWREGLFIFHNTPLRDILKQLSRWYDLDADLSNVPDKSVYGEIPRSVKLSEVLELLENSSHVQFEIHNRTIHVKNQTK